MYPIAPETRCSAHNLPVLMMLALLRTQALRRLLRILPQALAHLLHG